MSKVRWAQATLVALATLIFIGCGGGGGGGGTSTGTTTSTTATTGTTAGGGFVVTISPHDAATVVNGQRTFSATVQATPAPPGTAAVTWSVLGTNSGSITQSGVYTAPSTPGTYTIKATATADPTKFDEVQIVVGTMAFIHTSDLPGGIVSSGMQGVNSNGTVVVGFGTPTPPSGQAPANNAALWRDNGGLQALTNVGPGVAYATDAAGTTVVGVLQQTNIRAFSWTGGVATQLAELPSSTGPSTAFGVSDDGTIIVGQGSTSTNQTHAVKWIGGTVTDLGTLSGGTFSLARAISGDGTVIVGQSGASIGARAVEWVNGGSPTSLGVFSGGTESLANAVNTTGTVIVGESGSNAGGTPHTAAFKWTSGTGLVDLGNLGGSSKNARAFGVSGDGTIIVGESQTGATVNDTEAFIYENGTMQNLESVLKAHGMTGPLTGWTLLTATAISEDGKVIVGQGKNPQGAPEGYLAILP